MKTYLLMILIFLNLLSCESIKNLESINGKYSNKYKYLNYNLELKSDSSFIYSINYSSGSLISKCSGNWRINNSDSITLYCKDEGEFDALTSTYMKSRINKFKIFNKKLIDGKLILRKQ